MPGSQVQAMHVRYRAALCRTVRGVRADAHLPVWPAAHQLGNKEARMACDTNCERYNAMETTLRGNVDS